MNIYHLKRTTRVGYDETCEIVIICASEARARELAAENAGDEAEAEWTKLADCFCIGYADPSREEEIVCRDFNAG